MTNHSLRLCAIAASALLLGVGGASAQQQQQQGARQQDGNRQVAQQCLDNLIAFDRRMDRDGYWLTGWGSRWGYGTPAATMPPPDGVDRRADAAGDERMGTSPWGAPRAGAMSPRYQISTLHAAANVLAHRGDQQGCNAALTQLRQVYENYVRELESAGVEPGDITSWRQERMLAAQPVEQLQRGALNVGDITGTEIRNAEDEELATISDIVIDPQSGGIEYVIASTDGIFGIGSEEVAVPWKALKATPGLNTFVLDVPEQVIEDAPKVDVERFVDQDGAEDQQKEVDSYWQQHMAG